MEAIMIRGAERMAGASDDDDNWGVCGLKSRSACDMREREKEKEKEKEKESRRLPVNWDGPYVGRSEVELKLQLPRALRRSNEMRLWRPVGRMHRGE